MAYRSKRLLELSMFQALDSKKKAQPQVDLDDVLQQRQVLEDYVDGEIEKCKEKNGKSMSNILGFVSAIPLSSQGSDKDCRDTWEFSIKEALRIDPGAGAITQVMRQVLAVMPNIPQEPVQKVEALLDQIDAVYQDSGRSEVVHNVEKWVKDFVGLQGHQVFVERYLDLLWMASQTASHSMTTLGGALEVDKPFFEKIMDLDFQLEPGKADVTFHRMDGDSDVVSVRKRQDMQFKHMDTDCDMQNYLGFSVSSQVFYNTKTGIYSDYTENIHDISVDEVASGKQNKPFRMALTSIQKDLSSLQDDREYYKDLVKSKRLLTQKWELKVQSRSFRGLEELILKVLDILAYYGLNPASDYRKELEQKKGAVSFVRQSTKKARW